MCHTNDALFVLADGPKEIPNGAMNIIERLSYFCLTEPAPAPRWLMQEESSFHEKTNTWCSKSRLHKLALEEHVKRAVYQGVTSGGRHCYHTPVLPSPTDWGWGKTEGLYEPHWTTLPHASKSCHELTSCVCKSGCRMGCRFLLNILSYVCTKFGVCITK